MPNIRPKKEKLRPVAAQTPPKSDQNPLPLTLAQERLWLLDRSAPHHPAANVTWALCIRDRLDVSALQQSLNEIVRRHQILRATLNLQNSQPRQTIAPNLTLPLPLLDLQALPRDERKTQTRQLTAAETQRPFDLARGPLLRAILLQLNAQEHHLLLAAHPIVFDDRSIDIFNHELATLYRAFTTGQPSPLPDLPIQYADYAAWQRQWLQSKTQAALLSYWQKRLAGAPPALELPTDRPRPAQQKFASAQHTHTPPSELTTALKTLCQPAEETSYLPLLAAYKTLLHRYTRQDDIVVGAPVANRRRPETERLIGPLVNTLALRTDLSGDPTFKELLEQLRQTTSEARQHQDLPFEKLIEELQPEPDPNRCPIFQATFTLQSAHAAPSQLPGLAAAIVRINVAPYPLDLALHVQENATSLHLTLEYNAGLFQAATIARLMAHFQTLLRAIAAGPDHRLADLPLLTAGEQHQLLIEWNDTEKKHPQDQCLHDLFQAQAEQTPDAVALVFENQCLTYSQLNLQANQLARRLQALGVGPEVPVGICLERSIEMIISLLGVLQAGGAYLPLDPAYPQDRLIFMLQDSQSPVLLTQSQLAERLPEYWGHVVCLDAHRERIAQESTAGLVNQLTADNLAYVIYTSGSTGNPKGVAIQHGSLTGYVDTARVEFALQADDRVLQFASISFDTAAEEIYPCLTCGATLVLRTEAMLGPAATFLRACQEMAVSVLDLPTAFWHELIRDLEAKDVTFPPPVRLVIVGGEKALPERWAGWQAQVGQKVRLVNTYGPTEATIVTTMADLTARAADEEREPPPIGYPIPDVQTYILDDRLQPAPIRVPGELHIAGFGLARGYLNRPALTAARFVPHPFSPIPGARLCKTGDLARYLPDGRLEFLGRTDHQIKIRGYRIEPGEIETTLEQHPAIHQAVVTTRQDESSNERLIAYLVPAQEHTPTASELRDFAKKNLPDHMLPSAFVLLQTLPLTPSGKIDRRALPAPQATRPDLKETFTAPRTPIEESLAAIWRAVLGLEQIGVHDDFFELGGHSLVAFQAIARARQALQIELPTSSIFDAPTIAALAERIAATKRDRHRAITPPIRPAPRQDPLPLSFAQQQLWLVEQLTPGNIAYNIPFPLCLTGPIDVVALHRSLNEIVRRHEALRTTFTTAGDQPVQIVAPSLTLPLPLIDLRPLPQAERQTETQRLARREARLPFDLATGPLVRTTLLQTTETEHTLLLTMHHIISDGWTIGVFIDELAALYRAFSTNNPSPLPELSLQYADFALWQRAYLQGAVLEKQLAYWQQQLAAAPAILELPTDHPRPATPTFRGNRQSQALPPTLNDRLEALSRQENVTLFMILLAAFQALLYRYTDQTDIIVGAPLANRHRSDVEELIGYFVNVLALRATPDGHLTFRQLLAQVRQTTLSAYAHQSLPFAILVKALHPKRDTSYNPLFQVAFAFQNAPTIMPTLPGLRVAPMTIDRGATQFDLTLEIEKTETELTVAVEYSTDLFDHDTAARMLGHYYTLLESIVAHPEQQLLALPLLTPAEQRQLLVDWNDAAISRPPDRCIHQLFEAQAEQTPTAVALISENEILTYRELNRRANQLAHLLQKSGVGPETFVGLCVEPSPEMLVGILGILKAGGAYVPLDPAYPPQRLAFMLQDARLTALLTQEQLAQDLFEPGVYTLCLDADWQTIVRQSNHNPVSSVTPHNPAYVIYTSGSTGKPKGVTIAHANLCPLLHWGYNNLQLTPADRVIQYLSYCFDWSVWEIFITLTSGASLYVIPRHKALDPETTLDFIAENRITVLHGTPTQFQPLIALGRRLQTLKYACIGAEKLSYNLLASCHNLLDAQCRIFNMYGPTETTIIAAVLEIDRTNISQYQNRASVPIGQPVANLQCHVLDPHGNLRPVGVPGQLHITGDGLARGYLNRPQLTAEKFAPNPLAPRERIYRTGDLVKWLPDGNLEFLGRIDHQIKMRGLRIELGEIEAVLSQHPAVQDTVVLAREDEPGDKRLVAYVVPVSGDEQTLAVGDLRRFLSEKLPGYMLPSAIVTLHALPLTPNGKVDRRSLPAPDPERPDLEESYAAPCTPVEEILTQIWQQVLGITRIGIHDNFFELGGHSLLATQIVSQVRQSLGAEIPVQTLFQAPTIRGLAAAMLADPDKRPGIERAAELLTELAQLSEEEIELMLARETSPWK